MRLSAIAAEAGYFFLHFAEMGVAMLAGMMIFVPVRLALAAQWQSGLLDASSLDSRSEWGFPWSCP